MLKFPQVNISKLTVFLAILTWLGLLFVDLARIFGEINEMNVGIGPEFTWILEIVFFILLYLFFNHSIAKHENENFLNLIWRASSTGLTAMAVSILIAVFYYFLEGTQLYADPLLRNFFYHVNFALTSLFLVSTSLLWKHLILYQKTKTVVQQWQAFEVILLLSMFFVLINQNTFNYGFIFGLIFLVIYSVILSANLKWIPYLTFKEKWKSLLFLAIIIVCGAYLLYQLIEYVLQNEFSVNLTENLFILGLFAFVLIYSIFSFLVTLFNLPTSSVFEQKLVEAINFQKLSQSIQPGENEERVLDILMDSCMSAAYVDAAWLEIKPTPEDETTVVQKRFINSKEQEGLRTLIASARPFGEFLAEGTGDRMEYIHGRINHELYQSVLIFHLKVNKNVLGNIFLLKEVKDGFNKEMINIISTFVGQASISVENYRLLNQAIKNERYKEELEIAQRVQRSLLPSELHHNATFEIEAFSAAADEVGGDYYETFQFDEHRFALIIGDVSGKGTSAAFNMSQMKGVFHSLVQLQFSPMEFLGKANNALGRCLEKNHFITTTYYLLDTSKKELVFARAGHCPTLFYDSEKGESRFLDIKGMGLGVVRNVHYMRFLEEGNLRYTGGDVLVMYTDGIVEAKNGQNEEFGYDRLRQVIDRCNSCSAGEIKATIIQEIYGFIGSDVLPDDDYSLMVIKFKE
ncbi:Serine phosphatase RsbU, regulator of sigma subunit [Lunatimonas lonarensis]|uniref:Serine phosphatase RsbU, regulator of sigma subunit n=1 Tax=Lunatimonas lonarensis TaxID=1232681 RepID=R7ZT65_9BACT|nr:PP2C family protein-serine/threonine phosphatase [Lunatimonas lonarensis]EON77341.1 Serine phosphatase RsbU, regulator of sigma subunit [Lunatimonas lonarensis]